MSPFAWTLTDSTLRELGVVATTVGLPSCWSRPLAKRSLMVPALMPHEVGHGTCGWMW